ncbi:hypothetical protein [Mesorhizobium temperatum]|uniref:Uncharacterized protein n=1 Tax=Mesorhizobium temperatum TaxID=241416 RepID=A0A271LHP7_9HYPH|nr:hypothetical protein [Mesorhizobium temperatum]PAQ06738.1 hypothetical protein CIT26_24475 [Mesorhizobium temperatum]
MRAIRSATARRSRKSRPSFSDFCAACSASRAACCQQFLLGLLDFRPACGLLFGLRLLLFPARLFQPLALSVLLLPKLVRLGRRISRHVVERLRALAHHFLRLIDERQLLWPERCELLFDRAGLVALNVARELCGLPNLSTTTKPRLSPLARI